MDSPYDVSLDASTLALLSAFRRRFPRDAPDERVLGLMRDDMPADLKAWLHTYAHHADEIALGDALFQADNAMPLAEVLAAYSPQDRARGVRVGLDGLDLDAAVVIGNTADGEVFFAAAWSPGATQLTLVKMCLAGYQNDGITALGTLARGLRTIADNVSEIEDIDEAVRDLLTDPA